MRQAVRVAHLPFTLDFDVLDLLTALATSDRTTAFIIHRSSDVDLAVEIPNVRDPRACVSITTELHITRFVLAGFAFEGHVEKYPTPAWS